MKASESVKNYQSERRMYANYVIRNVKTICKNIGPRESGSEKELEAAKWMENELKTSCDDVKIEEFKLSPWAFMGWVQIEVFCGIVGSALLFASYFLPALAVAFEIAAVVLLAFGIFCAITEFLFYKQTLDPFFKKSVSHNVVAVRKAAGETKRRIIFSGHMDSAPEWRFTYWGGPKLLIPTIAVSLTGIITCLTLNVVFLVFNLTGKNPSDGKAMFICIIVAACFVPFYLFCILFYNKKRIVEGANDNLSGCLCSMAVPRFLQDQNIRFENTEVMVVCTGSEEAGLRGAKAFCKAHAAEINAQKDIETVFIGLDTVRDFDYMGVYNKDMTGTVKNNAEVSKLLKEGAKIAGYDIPYRTVTFGSSDAAAITQGGLKATCFAAMDPAPARYYHTRLDTFDNMDIKTVEAGIDIILETAFLFDEKGLNV